MCKEALSNPRLDLRTEKQDKVEVFRISLEDNGLPLRSLRKMTELEIIEILQRGQLSGCTYAKSWACSCVPMILGILKETNLMVSPGSRKTMMGNVAL